MPAPSTFALFAAAALAMTLFPGPSVLYVVTRSVSQGRRAGLVSMLGIEAGGCVHVIAAAAGVSALLASSATAFSVLKYAGAGYLIYLGARRLLSREGIGLDAVAGGHSRSRLFWQGMVVNTLNPKTAMFFLAFLPQFVDPSRGAPAVQILFLGLLFVLIAATTDGGYAVAAATAGTWLRSRHRLGVWLNRTSGGVFLALGAAAALSHSPAQRTP
jgi:threonine/homoserine/homoserine lactone efflux protein